MTIVFRQDVSAIDFITNVCMAGHAQALLFILRSSRVYRVRVVGLRIVPIVPFVGLASVLAPVLEHARSARPACSLGIDLDDLDSEDERVPRLDAAAWAPPPAVTQLCGDVQLPLVPLAHQLHRFRPSFDHLPGSERDRLPALVTAVEHGACSKGQASATQPTIRVVARRADGRSVGVGVFHPDVTVGGTPKAGFTHRQEGCPRSGNCTACRS